MHIPILTEKNIFETLSTRNHSSEYYALYSSWFGGIVKNPYLMLVPIDDHMVHRGDGVFEAIKAVERSVYLLEKHLQRLFYSAEKIGLVSAFTPQDIKNLILETLRVADQDNAIIRVFLSRGPGSFSVNPYDSIAAQLYIVVAKLHEPSQEQCTQGVRIGQSEIPSKSAWMAQIKSCNYLQNVLMKKEAVDRHLDFVVGIDPEGYVTESATENIMIVDQSDTLIHPRFDYILKGTTMMRVCELAREMGMRTQERSFTRQDLLSAREVMITGTTWNVLPVVEFEKQKIGDGAPGPIAKQLKTLLIQDMKSKICGEGY
jgi:4-amino-4-deoxychorismate lyase